MTYRTDSEFLNQANSNCKVQQLTAATQELSILKSDQLWDFAVDDPSMESDYKQMLKVTILYLTFLPSINGHS